MPQVFISYAHDSSEHRAAVRDFWAFLRSCGVDATLDWAAGSERRDWALWAADQVQYADFVLVIASPGYKASAEAREERGTRFESQLIREFLASETNQAQRFAAVVLPGQSVDDVPEFLAASRLSTLHVVRDLTVAGAESLLRLVTNQPAYLRPELGPAPKLEPRLPPRGPAVVLLATEWSSARGGLSTFNRNLCCALAARGAEVVCVVLAATDADVQDAKARNVSLRVAVRPPGGSDDAALSGLSALPEGFHPDYIIGHGRVTGPAAFQMAERFPEARRLHVIHMAPDEIEWHKPGRKDDAGERSEKRHQLELDLSRTAHATVAVGRRLYNRYLRDLNAFESARILNLVPGFDVAEYRCETPPPGAPWKILVAGRVEDAELKGLDIAARAVGLFVRNRPQAAPRVELVVRGAPSGESEQLRKQLLEWAGTPALDVVVRPYAVEQDSMIADLKTSTLVLMPSRKEGFGLMGLEAVAAGVPVLVSGSSGLGEHMQEALEPEDSDRVVIPVSGQFEADAEDWCRHIHATLYDRPAAFARAAHIREALVDRYTWAKAVTELLASV
ncbi:glycosyltransferase [Amycolatopsis sp. lyj-109]|uniref:glycosyltransferase n=1 Tax=Amycolatopsis sp. lyj-109 TaxID=2789287 RepID=UPI00397AA4FF